MLAPSALPVSTKTTLHAAAPARGSDDVLEGRDSRGSWSPRGEDAHVLGAGGLGLAMAAASGLPAMFTPGVAAWAAAGASDEAGEQEGKDERGVASRGRIGGWAADLEPTLGMVRHDAR